MSGATDEPFPAIRAVGLSKTFRLPHERRTTVREYLLNPFRRTEYEIQEALADVSFEIRRGEFFGVIGRNGSGKSTLLKILADIYRPDAGKVEINGKLSPFIELGAGFNPELNGRENLRINATLLGLSSKELKDRFATIVEFAELERFMDQKLKNYSSGMQVRLAYSIAIQVPFDILLIDEVLAVGDQNFQEKCFATFEALRENGKTVVLVTHGLEAVERFCDRALLLREGVVEAIGRPNEVIETYQEQEEVRAGQAGRSPGDHGLRSALLSGQARSCAATWATMPDEEPSLPRDGIASMPPEEIESLIERQQGRLRHHAKRERELVEGVREREQDFARAAMVTDVLTHRHYENLPVPPESLRSRTGAPTSELEFLVEGLAAAELVRHLFGEAPAKPTLEWGCGSGWIVRWLSCYPDWRTNYYGCDPAPEAVAWLCSQASFRVEVCSHEPPLSYPAATFGALFAFDMLTWLDPREHRQWFAELRRLLQPGGTAFVVTNGPFAVKSDEVRTALQAHGWAYTTDGEQRTPAFVTQEYTRRVLEGLFAVEIYNPHFPEGRCGWVIRRLE